MTPRETRVLFTRLVVELLTQIANKEWSYGKVEVAVDEWTINNPRIYIDHDTNLRRTGIDRVHHPKGFHPRGLAVDLLVYINGQYLRDGGHPLWRDLDQMAKNLDPKLRFGISFNDSNHLSYGEVTHA